MLRKNLGIYPHPQVTIVCQLKTDRNVLNHVKNGALCRQKFFVG
mgnify:CR=1 FL=1